VFVLRRDQVERGGESDGRNTLRVAAEAPLSVFLGAPSSNFQRDPSDHRGSGREPITVKHQKANLIIIRWIQIGQSHLKIPLLH
jgi:hypothetical protein